MKKYEIEIEKVLSNEIFFADLQKIEEDDLDVLVRAFELVPQKVRNEIHNSFLNVVLPLFSKYLFKSDHRSDYQIKHRMLNKLSYIILYAQKEDAIAYIEPFIKNARNSSELADFFQEFISVEDKINQYDNFWVVWNIFYDKVVSLCNESGSYFSRKIICNYLLAWSYWKEEAKDWHSLLDMSEIWYIVWL